jgi:pantoate--beta-alanine ligase
MPLVIHGIADMQRKAEELRVSGDTIGVVPTMGFLHDGHLSLIRAARQRARSVITTVFVNPTQFGPGEDLERYPRDLGRDIRLAGEAGSDIVFAPAADEMFDGDFRTYVTVAELTAVLEGKSRPSHFRGVTTVVAKLFNITKPHLAVFGQKDAQQVVVIRRMVRDLNFDIEIVVAPIVREPDGLAMSSRNTYLSPEQRRSAPAVYAGLKEAELRVRAGERSGNAIRALVREIITSRSPGTIDYVSVADADTLLEVTDIQPGVPVLISAAVRFGSTRLIDNVQCSLPS